MHHTNFFNKICLKELNYVIDLCIYVDHIYCVKMSYCMIKHVGLGVTNCDEHILIPANMMI